MSLRKVTSTCMDMSESEIEKSYGHLPKERIYEWAAYQAALSVEYAKTGKGVSITPEGAFAKRQMMERLQKAFEKRGNPDDWRTYQPIFHQHLEDPGTLENFRYFCVPDSDEMIMFYASIWTGDMASAMEYLHRYGRDLKGEYRYSPTDEAWYRMTELEGIAVNERKKAEAVAELLLEEGGDVICFFGGGNLPERLYDGCLHSKRVRIFETGKMAPIESLENIGGEPAEDETSGESYRDFLNAGEVTVYQENLLQASSHADLLEGHDAVIMHGVSMYLGKGTDGMVKALENGIALLYNGGVMSFDYLLMTDGMKRTATAQHWPNAKDMKIFESVDDAIKEGKEVIRLVNEETKEAYFDLESITVNSVEPWGETSVRFVVRKYNYSP